MPRQRTPLIERILSRIEVEPETGCWLWPGATVRGGYGQIASERRGYQVIVHRALYELLVGPIPDGLNLDHVKERGCRHTNCCNPDHLEPVSQRENLMRGDTVTARHAAATHCPQGHAYDAENTRFERRGGRACRACNAAAAQRRYQARKRQGG